MKSTYVIRWESRASTSENHVEHWRWWMGNLDWKCLPLKKQSSVSNTKQYTHLAPYRTKYKLFSSDSSIERIWCVRVLLFFFLFCVWRERLHTTHSYIDTEIVKRHWHRFISSESQTLSAESIKIIELEVRSKKKKTVIGECNDQCSYFEDDLQFSQWLCWQKTRKYKRRRTNKKKYQQNLKKSTVRPWDFLFIYN